jgi:hypothetical protein
LLVKHFISLYTKTMEEMLYIGVRIPRRTHDAIVKIQQASRIQVSLTAVVQHLLEEALGLEKQANGKKRRQR